MPEKAANPQTYVELGQRLGNAAQELANMRDVLNKMFIFIVLGFVAITAVSVYQAQTSRQARGIVQQNSNKNDQGRVLLCMVWHHDFPDKPYPPVCIEALNLPTGE